LDPLRRALKVPRTREKTVSNGLDSCKSGEFTLRYTVVVNRNIVQKTIRLTQMHFNAGFAAPNNKNLFLVA